MNVLQINTVCGVGSTGRIVTDLHAILQSSGHRNTVAFGRDTAKSCDEVIRIGSRLDNYVHVARTRLFDSHGFGSLLATKKFVSEIRELNPDIIHLHNLHGYYLHVGLLFEFLKNYSKPVVWTLHDCWSFTGHCAHFDFVGCDRWQSECHHCPLKAVYPKNFGLDRSRWNYSHKKNLFNGIENLTIVTPSHWLAQLVKKSFLAKYPVMVINNGIDLNVFRPTSSDFRRRNGLDEKFVILGVASVWNDRKGYSSFLDLASRLRLDEKLVLVGLNDKQMVTLPSNIVGIAKTNSIAELAEIYSSSDLFINPTLEDTFPTTNLESLACGTPVITFDVGGSPESLSSDCGLVVDRGDLDGLVDAIKTVKINGKEFYSFACRRRAEELYCKDTCFAKYLETYRGVLEQKEI